MHFISKKHFSIYSGITLLMVLILASLTFRAPTVQASTTGGGDQPALGHDIGHDALPANDGWASAQGGTTGGASAAPQQVYTVTNRAQLVQALGGDNTGANATPKIIYIKGVINGNEDDAGKPLTCADYVTDGYSLATYLQTYDPAVWGRTSVPSGPVEAARVASHLNQSARVQIFIPPNTTIVGADPGARVIGANFMVQNVDNVIIRNIQFENAFDCFPQWDPTDGATGNWNSAYDNVSVTGGTHVWVDHNSFTDAGSPDSQQPTYFGREYQQHDGELDITKGADLVTASWNRFANHDKTMLIGSTDKPTYDVGKLRVTLHHNDFENTIQRLPRVRYGQVHVYDNYYNEVANPSFSYALGVGVSSQIYTQNNYYVLPPGFNVGKIIGAYKGTAIHTEGDIVNGQPADILAAFNALNTPTLGSDVGWTPQYYLPLDPTEDVPELVRDNAGADRTITVSQDGKSDFTTIQAAINAVPDNNAEATTISIAAGTYNEVIKVPADKPYISLVGDAHNAKKTVIAYNDWSGSPAPGGGTLGTSGSATATLSANDFDARYITFANTFDESTQPQTNQHQAVAVKTSGDRMTFEDDRFLGNQDTLYVNSPSTTSVARQLFVNSYIEGTIDFIFGRGTAVFDNDTIFIKNTTGTGPKMTAASTPAAQQYGFLIDNSKIESSAPAGTAFLGRPWPATTDALAQVTVRNSWLAAAIGSAPWQSWTSPPLPWQSVRFAEYKNYGPGAGVNANRPQLTEAQAHEQIPANYLLGQDAWTPKR